MKGDASGAVLFAVIEANPGVTHKWVEFWTKQYCVVLPCIKFKI